MDNDIVLALDLGGTNMRLAAIDRTGEVLDRRRGSTEASSGLDEILGEIEALATELRTSVCESRPPIAFAAAIPATSIDPSGALGKLPNLPQFDGVDLKGVLSQKLDLPVTLLNDASAATLGEHWRGASRGATNAVGVTLGTGVGGGIVIDGRLHAGYHSTSGELGHICVEPDGRGCGCGSRGCLERYSSGTAIVRDAEEAGLDAKTSLDVYKLAEAGDEEARRIFSEMGRYLGIGLSIVVNLLAPDVIVIGGGVAGGWPLFIDSVTSEVKRRGLAEPANHVKIIRALLGDDAGVLGAAKFTFQLLKSD